MDPSVSLCPEQVRKVCLRNAAQEETKSNEYREHHNIYMHMKHQQLQNVGTTETRRRLF